MRNPFKLGFYAANEGPGKLMATLASVAKARGHQALVCPPLGIECLDPYISRFADDCAAVVLGYSPDQRHDIRETVVIKALRGKRPIVCVEDFPKIALTDTQDFRDTASDVTAVFTALPGYERELIHFGYLKAAVRHVGPPAHWHCDTQAVQAGKKLRDNGALRKRRRGDPSTEVTLDPHANARIVYVSGGRNIVKEAELMLQVLSSDPEVVLHYRGHPGERSLFHGREQEFERLKQELEQKLEGTWMLANYELLSPTELTLRQTADAKSIGTADVCFVNPGASSLNWAGYAGIVIACAFPLLRTEDRGFDYEFLAPRVARVIRDLREVPDVVRELLSSDGRQRLWEHQRQNLRMDKSPMDWNTGPKIMEAIEELID